MRKFISGGYHGIIPETIRKPSISVDKGRSGLCVYYQTIKFYLEPSFYKIRDPRSAWLLIYEHEQHRSEEGHLEAAAVD